MRAIALATLARTVHRVRAHWVASHGSFLHQLPLVSGPAHLLGCGPGALGRRRGAASAQGRGVVWQRLGARAQCVGEAQTAARHYLRPCCDSIRQHSSDRSMQNHAERAAMHFMLPQLHARCNTGSAP